MGVVRGRAGVGNLGRNLRRCGFARIILEGWLRQGAGFRPLIGRGVLQILVITFVTWLVSHDRAPLGDNYTRPVLELSEHSGSGFTYRARNSDLTVICLYREDILRLRYEGEDKDIGLGLSSCVPCIGKRGEP